MRVSVDATPCMYVCMYVYVWLVNAISRLIGNQPGTDYQFCSWTAEKGKRLFSLNQYTFAPDNLVSCDVFGRPVLRQPGSFFPPRHKSSARSRHSSRLPQHRPFIYTVNRDWVNLEFMGPWDCVPMAFTAESPPAQGQ